MKLNKPKMAGGGEMILNEEYDKLFSEMIYYKKECMKLIAELKVLEAKRSYWEDKFKRLEKVKK